jgi:serine/threonine protein kinase
MSPDTIFAQAIEIASAQERAVFLEQACGSDPGLRRELEQLVRDHFRAGAFLERPAAHLGAIAYDPVSEQPGTVIGPYKLMEQIGEGGFGLVFVAEQQQPIRRKVALKVIKPGMDSRQVIARFEAERQALALMDHPHIAKVLDGGTTASGRPYFVMELVKGVPITQFCDENRLTTRERLGLFVSVCQAVQHAHTKGIIHRDLKPSNVLVTSHDGTPVVKVIDFGVAKAIGQQLTDKTIYTRFTQLLGTPLYMSPEQAGQSGLDIDTRTDIYALGVLLYELLTGTTPFDQERLGTAAYDEIRRIIREEEPAKPSTRISTLGPAAATVSAKRQSDPKQLSRLFRGELDWVVMKALEKDRNRRYETASAFAADVQRYLHDETVHACPPSAGYRLRKFARRHKGPVLAASLVVLALVGGIVGTTVGLVRAEQARKEAVTAREAEAEQRRIAEEERAVAQAVNDFVQKDLLGQADLENQPGGAGVDVPRDPDIQVRTVLDRAAKTIEGRFASQPRVEAAIRLTIAKAYLALGHSKEAQLHAERSVALHTAHLGADHADTLTSKEALAEVYYAQGFHERAEALCREVLEKRTAALGPDHLDTLTSKHQVAFFVYGLQRKYDQAEPLLREVVQKRETQLGAHDPATLRSKHDLAWLHMLQRKYDLAAAQYVELIKAYESTSGEDHPGTLLAKTGLALVYANGRGQYAQAEPLLREVLQKRIALQGPGHPHTLWTKVLLGSAYGEQRKYDQAVPMLEEALAAYKASLGEDHPRTLQAMQHLAAAYRHWGKPELALPHFEQMLAKCKEKRPPDDDQTLNTMNGLAGAYLAAKMPEKAVPLYEAVLTKRKERLGSDDPRTLTALGNLADAYRDTGRPADAVPLFEELIRLRTAKQGAGHFLVAAAKVGLGQALLYQKKYAEAEPLLREGLAVREKQQPGTWWVASAQSSLGDALAGQQKYAEAEPLLLTGYAGLKRGAANIPAQSRNRLAEALERLVRLYDAWGKESEAARWRAEWEQAKARPKH